MSHYDANRLAEIEANQTKELLNNNGVQLIKGDCLQKMVDIKSGSVDMILTDVPYGTIKNSMKEKSGKYKSEETSWDTKINTLSMFNECDRILRKNGACALFAQEPYTGELTTSAIPNLPFSYRLTWLKDHFANCLSSNKAPLNYTEDICLFFKKHTKYDFGGDYPLREYGKFIFSKINKSNKDILIETGSHAAGMSIFYFNSINFKLGTEKTYNNLIDLYSIDKIQGFIEFKELKEIEEEFKKSVPKTFNLPEGQKFKSNVLSYKKDYMGLHPTQKPVALLEDLILTYTRPGDTVLDFTCGSGSTAIACLNTGRKFIGIELDDNYFQVATDRIKNHLTSKNN